MLIVRDVCKNVIARDEILHTHVRIKFYRDAIKLAHRDGVRAI